MRYVAYRPPGSDHRERLIGLAIGDMVAPLADIDSFYDDLPRWTARARTLTEGTIPLDRVVLAPPVPRDAKILCAAINYRKHGAEANLPTPSFPNLFARWTSELVTDQARVPVPAAEPEGLDWEVELAAIVGATLVDATSEQAAAGIFGYTVSNEISARGAQLRAATLSTGQWALGKNPDRSAAIGSYVTSADAVDAADILLETIVDGQVMQSGSTADMVFSVSELIAFASQHVTLRPGDLVLTGTPDGVGLGRTPRVYMKPGATVTVSAGALGAITNFIVDGSHRG